MSSLLTHTVLRGYTIFIWLCGSQVLGEAFITLHESGNDHDNRHATAVYCGEDPGGLRPGGVMLLWPPNWMLCETSRVTRLLAGTA